MVTTDEDEAQPIGAVAALGGHVQDIVSDVTHRVTYGEPSLLTPLALILLTLPLVLTQTNVWLAALGAVSLFALTVWCVVTVTRAKR